MLPSTPPPAYHSPAPPADAFECYAGMVWHESAGEAGAYLDEVTRRRDDRPRPPSYRSHAPRRCLPVPPLQAFGGACSLENCFSALACVHHDQDGRPSTSSLRLKSTTTGNADQLLSPSGNHLELHCETASNEPDSTDVVDSVRPPTGSAGSGYLDPFNGVHIDCVQPNGAPDQMVIASASSVADYDDILVDVRI